METQSPGEQSDKQQIRASKRKLPRRLRLALLVLGLIFFAICAFISIRGVWTDLDKVMTAIFAIAATVCAFLALPFLYSSKDSEPSTALAISSYQSILTVPPLTDRRVIQQREPLVESITTKLTQPSLNALVLTGIGGVGKSTLAALIYHRVQRSDHGICRWMGKSRLAALVDHFVEVRCHQGTSPFAAPPLWLSIDALTTFADIMGTVYQAVEKPLPDLKSLSPASQAQALCTLLSTTSSRLVVLDQFDHFLDWGTGAVLPDRPGVGEWLDALNSQPWSSGCRLLFTSRPGPKGTRVYAPLGLQEYPVEGLTIAEGMDLLRKRGVQAEEGDLQKAVTNCNGHALSLELLIALVKGYPRTAKRP